MNINPYEEPGLWLNQATAIQYTGKTQTVYLNKVKPKLLTKKEGKMKLYFLPKKMMDKFHQENFTEDLALPYPDRPIRSEEDDQIVEEILGDVSNGPITEEVGDPSVDIVEARRKEILTRTKYLEQKIIDKKHQLFAEWSERFFDVFQRSFSKFKNSLIELHLNEEQIKKLNENLDLALQNLENTLAEINDEYINSEEEEAEE